MARAQLALNVTNLDEAVSFYSRLFATPPAKVRAGYANFAVADPPLKLVLIENPAAAAGSLNHLGVELASTDEVGLARARLAEAAITTKTEEGTTCCYAVQDKVWAFGPQGAAWEFYTVLADAPSDEAPGQPGPATACCGAVAAEASAKACC
jgi:catechol 2,3-dioxygenase-like lactoylglutathione lyase family enzyme